MINVFVKSIKENGEDTAFPQSEMYQDENYALADIWALPLDMALARSF